MNYSFGFQSGRNAAPLTAAQQVASDAVSTANQDARTTQNLRPGYSPPWRLANVWRTAIRTSAVAVFGGAICGALIFGTAAPAELAVLTSVGVIASLAPTGEVSTHSKIAYARAIFTQGTPLVVFNLLVKSALEQLAIAVDPTLSADPASNSTVSPFNHTMAANSSLCSVDDPCWSEQAGPWLSLMVIGFPMLVATCDMLIPIQGRARASGEGDPDPNERVARDGVSLFNALADAIEYQVNKNSGQVERLNRQLAKAIRVGGPPAFSAVLVGVHVAFAMTGNRTAMLRWMSVCTSYALTARARDWLQQITNVARGGAVTDSLPPSGWRAEQMFKIPQEVLDALQARCGGDKNLYGEALGELQKQYRSMLLTSRGINMLAYGGAGVAGSWAFRTFLAPPVHGVFASPFSVAADVFLWAWVGSTMAEGQDDGLHVILQKTVSSLKGMPIDLTLGEDGNYFKAMEKNWRQAVFLRCFLLLDASNTIPRR